MVARRSTQSVTQRSTRSSELHMTRRPRRLVPPKTVDDTVGLSRKEERELKKALYASLQETRRNRNAQSEAEENSIHGDPPKTRKSVRQAALSSGSSATGKRSLTPSMGVDDSSQDSMVSSRSVASSLESKKKIQAQRKFAQGCSAPGTPSSTPNKKSAHSPHNLLDRVPKTEDFLTFLCLRGSHILPPHLDFFNFARDGASGEDSSSRPRTPVSAEQPNNAEQTRESTPESSSSGSNMNEELMEIASFSTPSRLPQASRKAARASAGTPETARGIVSLRQGLTRKPSGTARQKAHKEAKGAMQRRSQRSKPVSSAFKEPYKMPLRTRRSEKCARERETDDDTSPVNVSEEGSKLSCRQAEVSENASEQRNIQKSSGGQEVSPETVKTPMNQCDHSKSPSSSDRTPRHPSSPYESAFLHFLSVRDPESQLNVKVGNSSHRSPPLKQLDTRKLVDQRGFTMPETKMSALQIDVGGQQQALTTMADVFDDIPEGQTVGEGVKHSLDKERAQAAMRSTRQRRRTLSEDSDNSGEACLQTSRVHHIGSSGSIEGSYSGSHPPNMQQRGSRRHGVSARSTDEDCSDSRGSLTGSVSSDSSSQQLRVPAGSFKPVEPAHSKHRRDSTKSSSASPVRRILEGASKKLLKKAHDVDRKAKARKTTCGENERRDTRREKEKRKQKVHKRSGKSREERKKTQEKEKIVKMKRRTSQRLKTLAKILGRKRPNYSLVVSGYADMEEYEEEQKKKAAKSALAKAKAEARARASARAAQAKQPDKVMTRSSSVSSTKDVNEKPEKKSPPQKRPAPITPKKEQSNLASIIEHKRLRRDSTKDEGKEESGNKSSPSPGKDSGSREGKKSGSRSASASPSAKKVTPRRSPQDKSSPLPAPSPDPALANLDSIPTFRPTEEEFSDPISFIASISDQAEPYGMCRIIPPSSWKMESKVNEEIRFTTQIQHLHRLFNRWGPAVEQSRAITHHLRDVISDQNACIPQIGGVEVDLPQLYRMIRDLGGLQNIVDKKQWVKVADAMKIPKAAHDRVTRLYDVYCKYVLPYAMLTEAERQQAQNDVHSQYELSSAEDDAILKGKSMTLYSFSRIARNVQSMWFKDNPNPEMVEAAYWKIVKERDTHVAVQCAHVNTRAQATAFPTRRESPYFRHSWNLNNLPENKKCILKCLGPVSGATIPTLHVGMLFSTSCWSTDPHRLPYVQYLHTGASTIWYCIPKCDVSKFHDVMKEICPTLLHNDPLWLKEDIAMVKPDELTSRGVRVARCVQQPRQFVVVFPEAYTATVCCGYNVSESVHYATTDWLSLSIDAAKALCESGEKELFSVDTLVCGLCQDSNDPDTLAAALPLLESIVERELDERHQLSAAGLRCERRLAVEDSPGTSASLARKRSHDLTEDSACEVCFKICYLSMVLNEHDEQILCLEHGLRHVQRKRHVKAAKLFYRYTEEELTELVQATKDRLATLACGSSSTVAKKRMAVKRQDSRSSTGIVLQDAASKEG